MKIESLTEEQKDRFTEFKDRWMKIGLSTEPADRSVAESALRRCYEISALTQPKQILWATSPLAGCVLIAILKDEKLMGEILKDLKKLKINANKIAPGDSVGASVWAPVGVSVRDSIRDSVGASVWDSVWSSVRASVSASVGDSVGASVRDSVGDSVSASVRASVGASVGDSVGDSIRDSVGDSVWDSVGDSVWDSVWDSVRDSIRASIRDSVGRVWNENLYLYYFGQFDAGALGYFEYFKEVCGLIEETERAIPLWDLSRHSSWVYPYENIAVLSEKPEKISVNKTGKIHCEDGPCVLYRDGFAVYGLNGVRVPKEIVETPADKLSSDLVLREKNAEVRREIVRKIGTERICIDLKAECVDKKEGYELLLLDLKDGRKRPYLKMLNPSIGTIHIEGVHPDCLTVEKALAWRNGTDKYIKPEVLT